MTSVRYISKLTFLLTLVAAFLVAGCDPIYDGDESNSQGNALGGEGDAIPADDNGRHSPDDDECTDDEDYGHCEDILLLVDEAFESGDIEQGEALLTEFEACLGEPDFENCEWILESLEEAHELGDFELLEELEQELDYCLHGVPADDDDPSDGCEFLLEEADRAFSEGNIEEGELWLQEFEVCVGEPYPGDGPCEIVVEEWVDPETGEVYTEEYESCGEPFPGEECEWLIEEAEAAFEAGEIEIGEELIREFEFCTGTEPCEVHVEEWVDDAGEVHYEEYEVCGEPTDPTDECSIFLEEADHAYQIGQLEVAEIYIREFEECIGLGDEPDPVDPVELCEEFLVEADEAFMNGDEELGILLIEEFDRCVTSCEGGTDFPGEGYGEDGTDPETGEGYGEEDGDPSDGI